MGLQNVFTQQRNQQTKQTIYRIERDACKLLTWQGTNIQNTQGTQAV